MRRERFGYLGRLLLFPEHDVAGFGAFDDGQRLQVHACGAETVAAALKALFNSNSAACNLAVDLCATSNGVLVLLKDECSCTLGNNKTITILIEWDRCILRILRAAECLAACKATDSQWVNSPWRVR